MAKLRMLAVSTALAIACVPLVACVSAKPDATFSDMEVTVGRVDGWLGSHGATFEVKGNVTNTSQNPINSDNLPVLVEEDGDENVASISQDRLLPGETCVVTYTGTIPLAQGKASAVEVTGKVPYVGLGEVVQELNDSLAGIAEQYETEENKQEDASDRRKRALKELASAERKTASEVLSICKDGNLSYHFEDSSGTDVTSAVESASVGADILEAAVRRTVIKGSHVTFTLDYADHAAAGRYERRGSVRVKAEQARRDLPNCTGKTAEEALELAETAGVYYKFLDSAGVDVTMMVKSEKPNAEVAQSVVAEVEMDEGGLYSVGFATFVLDYTDEAAAARHSDFQADQTRIRKVFENSMDRTVEEVIELAEGEGVECMLIDAWNNDVTERAAEDAYEGWRSRAVVTSAMITARNAVFHLDRPLTMSPEDNDELAGLLSLDNPRDGKCADFAAKYKGHTIEFDGCIVNVTRHGSYNTRFDYLVKAGDFTEADLLGPDFRLEDVSFYDFGATGDFPDDIEAGVNLHFYAEVVEYNGTDGFFYLKPVQTTGR